MPVIGTLRRRLRLVFAPAPNATSAPIEPDPALPPEVDFTAYAADCRIFGRIRLEGDRLTDMLNAHDELLLVDVMVASIADGHVVERQEVLIDRDEILVVHAVGPRGDERRRHRTRPHPVALQVGPYSVKGYFHALPGSDPLAAARLRRPMLPLTDAWLEFSSGEGLQRARVGTLIVNHDWLDWIQLAADEDIKLPDVPYSRGGDELAKDFTGNLLTFRDS